MATPEAGLRVGITGASGYIGRALLRGMPPGWSPVSLGRRAAGDGIPHRFADLREPPHFALSEDLDALVHLAADTTGGGGSEGEVAFAAALATHARARGIPLLFLSSQAASPDAPTRYGRIKAAIEQAILPLGATVIRPGLVYGGEERGLFGALAGVVRRFRLVPRLLPAPMVQPIHVDDLVGAMVVALADPGCRGKTFNVAGEPLPFDRFLQFVARYRLRRAAFRIPIPVAILEAVLSLAGRVLGPSLDPTRLKSLTALPVLDAAADLQRLRVAVRDPRDGLSRSGRHRRRLLLEARALACGFTSLRRVPVAILRRYVRGLGVLGQCRALDLRSVLLRHPGLLASLDHAALRAGAGLETLPGRLGLMCRLCESDPRLAFLFVQPPGGRSIALALRDLVAAAFREARVRAMAPIARRLYR